MKSEFGKISIYSVLGLLVLYIGVSSVFPPVSGYLGNADILIRIFLNFVFLVIAIIDHNNCFANRYHFFLVVVFVAYSTIVPYLAGNSVWANRYLDIMFFLTAPLICNFFKKHMKRRILKKNSKILMIFAFITFTVTMIALISKPYIVRSLKSGGEVTETIKKSGIGGYEFVYFIVIIGIAFFYCFWNYNKKILLIISILCFLFIVLSNYMTAVLLMGIGAAITVISGKTIKQKIIALIIIISIIIFYFFFMSYGIEILKHISPNGRIARLFSDENDVIETILGEFFYDRYPTLVASIKTVGVSHGLGAVFMPADQVLNNLGQHSHFLDTVAIWGIPIAIIYFYIIFKPLKTPACCSIVFFLLMLFNNTANSIALAMYIIVPFIIEFFNQKSDLQNELEDFIY